MRWQLLIRLLWAIVCMAEALTTPRVQHGAGLRRQNCTLNAKMLILCLLFWYSAAILTCCFNRQHH